MLAYDPDTRPSELVAPMNLNVERPCPPTPYGLSSQLHRKCVNGEVEHKALHSKGSE